MRGSYMVRVPAVLKRSDVLREDWPSIKANMIQNITLMYVDALNEIETSVKKKKGSMWAIKRA